MMREWMQLMIVWIGIMSDTEKKLINQLFSEMNIKLYHVSLKYLQSNADAEDAVSQSFLKMMEHIERISALPCHQRAPYCVIIVKNVCIDMLRKRKTIEPIEQAEWLEQAEDNKDMLWTSIDKTELMDAMSLLPIDDRKLIQLRFANEMSYREIARLFGISEDTAKKRGQRAIDKLRKCYEEKTKCLN